MTTPHLHTTPATTEFGLPSWASEYLGSDVALKEVTAPTDAEEALTRSWLVDTYVGADRSIADVAAIATEEFGFEVTEADVHTALDRHGITWRNGASPTPGLTRQMLVERYLKGGESLQTIADDLGVSRETVRQARERFGLPRRRRGLAGRVSSEELRELYVEQGLSIRQVAVELDASPSAVSRSLSEAGIESRTPTVAEDLVDVDDVTERYREGESIRSIAGDVDLSDTTVRDLLLRHDVQLRGKRRLHEEISPDDLAEMVDDGMGINEIAEELDCTPKSVYRLFARYDMDRPAT